MSTFGAMHSYYYRYNHTKNTSRTNKEQIAEKNSAVCKSYRASVQKKCMSEKHKTGV